MQRATWMHYSFKTAAMIIVAGSFVFEFVARADAQVLQGPPAREQPRQRGGRQETTAKPYQLPTDERLLDLHQQFVLNVEKLAADYEKTGQHDKARTCYTEILRLVPTYAKASEKLTKIKEKEMTAEKKLVDVYANKDWQDAGIQLIEGRPITIRANGQWTIKMTYNLQADGLEIPKELRDFPLGALIGKVADSPDEKEVKPFLIGLEKGFDAPTNGRLYLRIYDSDTSDNMGRLGVIIEGMYLNKK